MAKTHSSKTNSGSSARPFFQPNKKTGPLIQRQGNPPTRFNPMYPNVIREAARRSVEQREAPIRHWLNTNLRSYRLMDGNDIIRILRREVPQARSFAMIELQSLIRHVANQRGFTPPLMRQPSPASSSLPDLSRFTRFNFQWGPTNWNVNIPSSLRVRLPVALSAASNINFSLSATTSGSFNFSVELDALEHIKISSTSGVDVSGNAVSAGLRIETRRTVCRAQAPQVARRNIIAKGRDLTRAMNELQSPTTSESGEAAVSEFDRLTEVVSGIAGLYSAVNTATSACRQVSGISVDVGVRTPLDTEQAREERQGSQIGVTLTFPF